jgi:hypothetical protein
MSLPDLVIRPRRLSTLALRQPVECHEIRALASFGKEDGPSLPPFPFGQ